MDITFMFSVVCVIGNNYLAQLISHNNGLFNILDSNLYQ